MRRNIRVVALCNEEERRQLAELAGLLGRSQGDTLRWAVRVLAVTTGIADTLQGKALQQGDEGERLDP